MSNKLCLYERGNVTEPEMCSVWLKNSISDNCCRYFYLIASVGINIDCVTTQHAPKCIENCLSNFYLIIVISVITLKTGFFLNCRLIIL